MHMYIRAHMYIYVCVYIYMYISTMLNEECLHKTFQAEAPFESTRRGNVLFQDMVLVLAQLWGAGVPFVAEVPKWDEAVLATLKRLPGVTWTDGERCSLLY